MDHVALGRSDLRVSRVGLGTMTFGKQTDEAVAQAQLACAVDHGVNLIDTGEMYPVPAPDPQTQGLTETFIGNWLRASGRRADVVLATKVVGDAPYTKHIRDGQNSLDRTSVRAALEGSLRRLQTDYVDLYQVHWPARTTNALMQLGYRHDPTEHAVSIAETLEALSELVVEGKARAIGVSNETAWGLWQYLRLAEHSDLARIASVQNAYSLLNRSFEVALGEFSHRDGVGLIAYQLLGMGMLTGKYAGGLMPSAARLTLHPHPRYTSPAAVRASQAYVALAYAHGVDPAGMAIGFVTSRPFVTSALLAATTVSQLEHNLAHWDTQLSDELIGGIEAIHADISNPSP
ncbi:aldo/keto reductase [Amorphus sp. 3PC139-8]|uniref:aldo/keto reductase n=1 Tax=Amorphus sp. 3PC139-8 TaxID=2735676 RepID=UPI00345CC6D3